METILRNLCFTTQFIYTFVHFLLTHTSGRRPSPITPETENPDSPPASPPPQLGDEGPSPDQQRPRPLKPAGALGEMQPPPGVAGGGMVPPEDDDDEEDDEDNEDDDDIPPPPLEG